MPSDGVTLSRLRLPPMPQLRHWAASLMLATTALLYLVAGLSVTALQPVSTIARANVPHNLRQALPNLGTPPEAEPLKFREDVSPQDAIAINAATPLSGEPNPPARAYRQAFATPADRTRALECLTAAVYYEAAMEPVDGQRAVAQVVLNRVRHPAFPKTVCGVVFQGSERTTGCQFTFTCDGAIARTPVAVLWARARRIADEALAGSVYAPVGWSTHYHANYVVPYWSGSLAKAANVGRHIFYRWAGGWGHGPAFRFGPGSIEPQIALMRRLTSDPSTLSDAPATPDALLAAQAAAAAANPSLVANLPPTAATPEKGGIDSLSKAIVRRYEPMTPQAAANAAVAQTAQPSSTLHWALSGLPEKPQAPLGKKQASDAPPAAAPAPPHCLEGVRRLPAPGTSAAEKQAC